MSSSNDASAPSNASALGFQLLDEPGQHLRVDDPFEAMPSCSARMRVLALPPSSETTSRPSLPTSVGIDVLVAALDLGHGRAVDAALVRERGPAHERLVVVGDLVRDLRDTPRESP